MRITDPCVTLTPRALLFARIVAYSILVLIVCLLLFGLFAIRSKVVVYESLPLVPSAETTVRLAEGTLPPFPVSVIPERKEILENPTVETYLEEHLSSNATPRHERSTWFNRAVATLAQMSWYQNLASPGSRILVIQSGERKEQVAKNFGDILKWDRAERNTFLSSIETAAPSMIEGKFFPARYVVPKDASPEDVAKVVYDRFSEEILARYDDTVAAHVPLGDALTIASLLEREAYDFTDMREISGIIWNRLFTDMNLQLDASLQYAKGSRSSEPWWPKVVPRDKYIKSPYNTYQNEGLPPAPIANPSLDAIVAALNPRKTDCMFYFHDDDGGFHCTPTYEEHVALLKRYFGQGR